MDDSGKAKGDIYTFWMLSYPPSLIIDESLQAIDGIFQAPVHRHPFIAFYGDYWERWAYLVNSIMFTEAQLNLFKLTTTLGGEIKGYRGWG